MEDTGDLQNMESELRSVLESLRIARRECDEAKAGRVAAVQRALAVAESYKNERDEAREELRRVESGEMSRDLRRMQDQLGAAVRELQQVKARLKTVKQERNTFNAQYKSAIAAWASLERAALNGLPVHADDPAPLDGLF